MALFWYKVIMEEIELMATPLVLKGTLLENQEKEI